MRQNLTLLLIQHHFFNRFDMKVVYLTELHLISVLERRYYANVGFDDPMDIEIVDTINASDNVIESSLCNFIPV